MTYPRVEIMNATPEEGGYTAPMYDRASFLFFLEDEIGRTQLIDGNLSLLLVKGNLRTGEAVVRNTRPIAIRGEIDKDVYGVILPDSDIADSTQVIAIILSDIPQEKPTFGLAALQRIGSNTELSEDLLERATKALSTSKQTDNPITILLTGDQSFSNDQLPPILQGKTTISTRK